MIEFLPDEHIYLCDGQITPSVTQILHQIFPNKYKDIDETILNRAATFGTTGHSIIEKLDINDNHDIARTFLCIDDEKLKTCISDYLYLCDKHNIEPIEHEKIISYKSLYAGTLDMIAMVNGKRSLIDIKFTYECDEDYLSWQLGMYEMASGEKFENHYCLWLPKHKMGELIPIKIKTPREILKKLEELNIK